MAGEPFDHTSCLRFLERWTAARQGSGGAQHQHLAARHLRRPHLRVRLRPPRTQAAAAPRRHQGTTRASHIGSRHSSDTHLSHDAADPARARADRARKPVKRSGRRMRRMPCGFVRPPLRPVQVRGSAKYAVSRSGAAARRRSRRCAAGLLSGRAVRQAETVRARRPSRPCDSAPTWRPCPPGPSGGALCSPGVFPVSSAAIRGRARRPTPDRRRRLHRPAMGSSTEERDVPCAPGA